MSSVLHVHHGAPPHSNVVDALRSNGVNVIEAQADAAATPEVAGKMHPDAAIIDPEVDAPVRMARAIHHAAPHAHIVFMTTEESEAALRRELLFAPQIGKHWSVARADAPHAAEEAIRNALQSTSQRRNLRTTLGRMNMRIAGQPAAARHAGVSDHFLAAVLQQLSDGVIMVDTAGEVVAANDAAQRMFGPKLVRGVAISAVDARLGGLVNGATEDATSELAHDDTTLDVRVTKVKDDVSHRVGTAILAHDITTRRRAEARQALLTEASLTLSSTLELDAAMQRLAGFLSQHMGGTVVIDIAENGQFSRRAAATEAGPDVDAKLRQFPASSELHPAQQAFRLGKSLLYNDVSEEFLRTIAQSEGHYRLLRSLRVRALAVVPISSGRQLIGALTIGRATDFNDDDIDTLDELAAITARAVQNIWLYHAAEQANHAKEEFLATLSHELRTPMTAILGWIQLLRSGTLDDSTTREGLQAVERSAHAQAQLIDDLLDLSRIQMGKLHLQMQMIDIAAVLRAAAGTVRPAANAKEISIDVHAGADLVVYGDANRLQQVIWNLLSNSVKFSERGGKVTLDAHREGSHVRIDVSDTGRGIEPDFLPYVFDRFRQADSAATRKYGGLGLGLAIVRQLTELHGGSVSVASEGAGRGAKFSVCLPVPAAQAVPDEKPRETAVPSLDGMRVLLVEDDRASAQVLTVILKQAGAEVRTENSARAALAALRDEMPDLLVSDIAMPDTDGLALIREIRSTLRITPSHLPAIALSAFSDMKTRVEVLGAGFQKFLQKPVDNDVLVRAVAEVAKLH